MRVPRGNNAPHSAAKQTLTKFQIATGKTESRATIWLRVRLTEAQNKTLRADAKKSKLALAKFVRSRLGLQ